MRFDLDIDLDNTIDLRVQATFNYFANEVKQQVNGWYYLCVLFFIYKHIKTYTEGLFRWNLLKMVVAGKRQCVISM